MITFMPLKPVRDIGNVNVLRDESSHLAVACPRLQQEQANNSMRVGPAYCIQAANAADNVIYSNGTQGEDGGELFMSSRICRMRIWASAASEWQSQGYIGI